MRVVASILESADRFASNPRGFYPMPVSDEHFRLMLKMAYLKGAQHMELKSAGMTSDDWGYFNAAIMNTAETMFKTQDIAL